MHRWIVENNYDTDGLSIGDTTIAKYWPGLYLSVRTWRVDRKNIAARTIGRCRHGQISKTPSA